jgi:putative ABC transport system permease protein
METLLQDLRYGVRTLAKTPGFSAIAVLTLALGIGANSAIFSVVNAVLLAPLPFDEPERLVMVGEYDTSEAEGDSNMSYLNFVDFREQNRTFDDIAAYNRAGFSVTIGEEPERVEGALVSWTLFQTLQVQPIAGRAFLPEEDKKGAPPVVVISHGLWQRRFGGDPGVVGRALVVEGKQATVVGVMPAGFQFPVGTDPADMWAPLATNSLFADSRGAHFLDAVGRLERGVTVDQAKADLDAISAALEQQYPDSNIGYRSRVVPLHEALVGDVRAALLVLLGAVGFVLLIACVNVANLLLARALSRQKEIAIRSALGASRWRVARQLLTESLLLALVGGALGLAVAAWGADALAALVADEIPRAAEIGLDGRVVGFTFGVAALTGVVFGLAPALRLARADLNETLKDGSRATTEGVRHNRVRSALVVAEVVFSVVLLAGAGLMIRSLVGLLSVDTGFTARNVVTMDLTVPEAAFEDDPFFAGTFYRQALDRIASIPGIRSAAVTSTLPLSGNAIGIGYFIEGKTPTAEGERPSAPYDAVSPGYFRTMGIPVLRGRDFTPQDTKEGQPVIIISEALARRYWSDEDPVGKRMTIGYSAGEGQPASREIVGVVGNIKHQGLEHGADVAMYTPFAQTPWPFGTVVVAAEADPAGVVAAIRKEVMAVNRSQAVFNIRPMSEVVSRSVSEPRLYMALLAAFAGLALLLTAVGIYGVMAYSVSRRTHEIGIRMALGARPGDVLRLVVRQGMGLVLAGVAVGLVAAVAATKSMESLLFGVSAGDPLTLASVALLLVLVAFLAVLVPARRAAGLDPMIALRLD